MRLIAVGRPLLLSWLTVAAACAPIGLPPAPTAWSVYVEVWDGAGAKVPYATVDIDVATGRSHLVGTANFEGNGTATVPAGLTQSHLSVKADGLLDHSQHLDLTDGVRVPVYLQRPAPPAPPPLPRLTIEGRQFMAGGRRFVWRFVTGFSLLAHLAHGDGVAAETFLQWAADAGFNGVRVLAMADWADLPAAAGRAHLDDLLVRAAAHRLYVEVVALAATRPYDLSEGDLRDQVGAVGAACARHTNCVIELANENSHPSQVEALQDEATLRSLRALIPADTLVSFGSNCCGQPDEIEPPGDSASGTYPLALRGGDYLTVHVDRSRDTWDRTRRVRELETMSSRLNKPVVSDEPIGAAELDQPGRRSANPAEFFGQGVLARVFELGATMHLESGLRSTLPGVVEQACAKAFIRGSTLWPDGLDTRFENAGWVNSPVRSAAFGDTVVRIYSALGQSRGWMVFVGLTGDPGLELNEGWTQSVRVAGHSGIEVWEVSRSVRGAPTVRPARCPNR